MSNKICGEVLNKLIKEGNIKNVVLAHLSEECNTEEVAIDTVLAQLESEMLPNFFVAKQWESLPLIEV